LLGAPVLFNSVGAHHEDYVDAYDSNDAAGGVTQCSASGDFEWIALDVGFLNATGVQGLSAHEFSHAFGLNHAGKRAWS
jgi:hypothetical protein